MFHIRMIFTGRPKEDVLQPMGEASCILWAAAGLDPAAGGMAASHHPSCTGHQQLSWITIGTVYSLSSHPNIILYGIT